MKILKDFKIIFFTILILFFFCPVFAEENPDALDKNSNSQNLLRESKQLRAKTPEEISLDLDITVAKSSVSLQNLMSESKIVENNTFHESNYNYGLIFVYDMQVDSKYFIDKSTRNTLEITKEILRHYTSLKILQENCRNKPISIAINPEILEYFKAFNFGDNNANLPVGSVDKTLSLESSSESSIVTDIFEFLLLNDLIISTSTLKEIFSLDQVESELEIYAEDLTEAQLFDQVVRIYLGYLDEFSLSERRIQKIIKKIDEELLDKDDLEFLINYKKEKLQEVYDFFVNKVNWQKNWKFLVYPYFNAKVDLLASSQVHLYLNEMLKKSINLPYIAMWHVAKSFKKYAAFFTLKESISQELPQGIISDIDFIDKNVFNIFAIRDYEIVLNKGDFSHYEQVIIKKKTHKKNICLLFENVFLDYEYPEISLKIFKKNIELINLSGSDAVFIFDFHKINNIDSLAKIYKKIFKQNKYINSITKLQKFIIQEFRKRDQEVKEVSKSLKQLFVEDMDTKKEFCKVIDITEQDFIINLNNVVSWFDQKSELEYWQNLGNILKKLEKLKNRGKIKKKDYKALMGYIYKMNARFYLEMLDLRLPLDPNHLAMRMEIYKFLDIDFKEQKEKKMRFIANSLTELSGGLVVYDAKGDDYGDGSFKYPKNLNERGFYDIRKFSILKDNNGINIEVNFSRLDRKILDKLQLDIYIDLNGRKGLGNTKLLAGRKAFTDLKSAWEYCIVFNKKGIVLYQAKIDGAVMQRAELDYEVNEAKSKIKIFLPTEILTGDVSLWNYIVLTCAYDNVLGKVSEVAAKNYGDEAVFTGRVNEFQSNILDLVLSAKKYQEQVLKTNDAIIEIPAIGVEF